MATPDGREARAAMQEYAEVHVKPLLGEVLEAVLAERPADPRDYIANFFSSATNASVKPEQPAAEPRQPLQPAPEPEPEPQPQPQPNPEPEPAESENTSLWVGHLPDEMLASGIDKTESELRRLFSAYGVVAGVSVRKKDAKNRSWAFVTFTTDDGAQAALDCETEVTGADGAATVLLVRQAEVAANLNAKAGEHPPGALRSMWAAQTTRVLQNLRTPMQDVLDTLHDIAGGHPAIAERLGELASTLTSTEDLWAVEEKGEAEAGGLRARNRRFSEVTDESIRAFLLSHSNEQLHESQAFSQELTRKRKIARAARQTAEAQEAAPDQNLDVARVLPDIGQDARAELQRWAAKIDSWEFDIFRVDELSGGRPLAFVLHSVFGRLDLFSKLRLDERVVVELAHALDSGYTARETATYHNNLHGADTVQAMCFFITNFLAGSLVDTEMFAAILAAAMHDLDHPAVSNSFHVETSTEHAMLYNDQSVNENHHLTSGFRILGEHPIISHLCKADRKGIRAMVIRLVLATDLASHFDYISSMTIKLDSAEGAAGSRSSSPSGPAAMLAENDEGMLLMELAIKMSDVANGARATSLYSKWSSMVFNEFYKQGDMEKEAGQPVSAFMDREEKDKEPKCQASFLQYIVGPLFEVGKRMWPSMTEPTAQLERNKELFLHVTIK